MMRVSQQMLVCGTVKRLFEFLDQMVCVPRTWVMKLKPEKSEVTASSRITTLV